MSLAHARRMYSWTQPARRWWQRHTRERMTPAQPLWKPASKLWNMA